MYDLKVLFEMEVQTAIAEAIRLNEDHRLTFEASKASWLETARIGRALGVPPDQASKPFPALLRQVVVDRQATPPTITLSYPSFVGDPNYNLEPLPPPNPADFADIGGPIPGNPGLFWCGPKDTLPVGREATKDGKKYRRVGFLAGRGWYEEMRV